MCAGKLLLYHSTLRLKTVAVILTCCIIAGCTPSAKLSDVGQVPPDQAVCSLYIGPFIDMRSDRNEHAGYLGAKRGAFGDIVERVADERGVDEFVREQLVNAARFRDILADRKPDSLLIGLSDDRSWIIGAEPETDAGRLVLVGTIHKLSVDVPYRRNAEVDIDLVLIDLSSERVLSGFKIFDRDGGGILGGIFADTKELKSWLAKVLQDEALDLFRSPDFLQSVQTRQPVTVNR